MKIKLSEEEIEEAIKGYVVRRFTTVTFDDVLVTQSKRTSINAYVVVVSPKKEESTNGK